MENPNIICFKYHLEQAIIDKEKNFENPKNIEFLKHYFDKVIEILTLPS